MEKEYNFDNGKWLVGNCLDLMKDIPDNSIDMIICDLPYQTTSCSWDKIIPFEPLWEQYERIIKDCSAIVLFGNNPFTSKLICSKLDLFKQSLVWNKNKCGSPGLAKIRHMQTHEDIIIFGKNKITYNPQMLEGEPYKRNRKNAKYNNHAYGFGNQQNCEYENNGERYPKSIINISRNFSVQQQIHPTQKPVPLFEYLIKTYSDEGMLILDNCAGSGTTAIAAENTNRKWICMEQTEEYSEKAIERIKIECYGENPMIKNLENKFK